MYALKSATEKNATIDGDIINSGVVVKWEKERANCVSLDNAVIHKEVIVIEQ